MKELKNEVKHDMKELKNEVKALPVPIPLLVDSFLDTNIAPF